MTKEKAAKTSKKWSKIWLLNWVIIATFLSGLTIILMEEMLSFFNNHISTWKLFNFETWRPIHIITVIAFVFLLIEAIALLRAKKIDMVKTAEDVKELGRKK